MEQILFLVCSITAAVSGVVAITRIQPFVAALWMTLASTMVAILVSLNNAPIVGASLFFIAASTMLVIMLMSVMMDDRERLRTLGRTVQFRKVFGAFAAAYLIVVLALVLVRTPQIAQVASNLETQPLGESLTASCGMPLSLLGITLLVAIVCAITMGKRNV